MVNSVLGKQDELLEYQHLIANPKTQATWTHSYGNELRWLAQGMPGQVKGMDMIFFISKDKVPKKRVKDVTYSLITCLIRPKKIEEPNKNLAGNVADMSATCRPDSQMLALSADTALSCRHKTDPNTVFLCRGWPTFTPFFF